MRSKSGHSAFVLLKIIYLRIYEAYVFVSVTFRIDDDIAGGAVRND